MTNRNKIYLHVGLEKTGSTSFQNSLRCALTKNNQPINFDGASNQFFTASFLQSIDKNNRWTKKTLQRRSRDQFYNFVAFLKCNIDKDIILTSEHLSGRLDYLDIKDLLATLTVSHEVVVILVLRDQSSWLKSKYKEALKNGFSSSFDKYCEMNEYDLWSRVDFNQIVDDWRRGSEENADLKIDKYSENIIKDLAKIVNIELPNTHVRKNVSGHRWKYLLIQKLNRLQVTRLGMLRRMLLKFLFR